jgi:hypothetical protein
MGLIMGLILGLDMYPFMYLVMPLHLGRFWGSAVQRQIAVK